MTNKRPRDCFRWDYRLSNGDQVNRIAALALKRAKSVDFTGYWRRYLAE
jgi:hypothetical protein